MTGKQMGSSIERSGLQLFFISPNTESVSMSRIGRLFFCKSMKTSVDTEVEVLQAFMIYHIAKKID